jgi:hypothetical protein
MKSFMETFKEENAETEYCSVCLQATSGRSDRFNICYGCNKEVLAFKEFDEATQLEIMKEELQNAYN